MSFCKFYANIVKTERNQARLKLPRRILYSAKIQNKKVKRSRIAKVNWKSGVSADFRFYCTDK